MARKVSLCAARSRGPSDGCRGSLGRASRGRVRRRARGFSALDKDRRANSVRAFLAVETPRGTFLNLYATLGDRLTAGQQILALLIKVRILVPQLSAYVIRPRSFVRHIPRPHRLAVRTPASHVGNTGSIPVGVATDFASENAKIALEVLPWGRTPAKPPRSRWGELGAGIKRSGGRGGKRWPMPSTIRASPRRLARRSLRPSVPRRSVPRRSSRAWRRAPGHCMR